jgi:hypothetical protein
MRRHPRLRAGRRAGPAPGRADTHAKPLALIVRHRDRYERRPLRPEPERHIDTSEPGEKVQLDCFFIGRLSGTNSRRRGVCVTPSDFVRLEQQARLSHTSSLTVPNQICVPPPA